MGSRAPPWPWGHMLEPSTGAAPSYASLRLQIQNGGFRPNRHLNHSACQLDGVHNRRFGFLLESGRPAQRLDYPLGPRHLMEANSCTGLSISNASSLWSTRTVKEVSYWRLEMRGGSSPPLVLAHRGYIAGWRRCISRESHPPVGCRHFPRSRLRPSCLTASSKSAI
jgi:hypothetical protein